MTRPDRPAQAICRSNAAADCRRPGTRHSGSKIPRIVRAQADVRSRSAPIDGAFGEGRRGVRAVFVYLHPGHETATALRSWGAAHHELWKALWDRGCGIEVVAIVRTPEEDSRAETVLANWARDPRPSEFHHGIGREVDLIDQAIIKGDVPVLMEYGGLQAGMKRSVALTKRARRQAGRRLMQRTDTWRTVRLARARFR